MLEKVGTIVSLLSSSQLVPGCCISLEFEAASFTPIMLSPVSEQEIPVPVLAEPSHLNDSIQSLQGNFEPHFCTSLPYTDTTNSKGIKYQQNVTFYHYDTQYLFDFFYGFIVSCIALYLYFFRYQRESLANQQKRFRNNTLTHAHQRPPTPLPRCSENVEIILDYDDTIFPTHYTVSKMQTCVGDDYNMDQTEWDQLKALNSIVYKTLLMWIELCGAANICIVSNGTLSWINETFLMYNGLYQNVRDLLILNQIKVISATDRYRSEKASAFMAILKKKKNINKVICIGDSQQEYIDIEIACSVLQSRRRRKRNGSMNYCRFKLLDKPSLNTMIAQFEKIKRVDYTSISHNHYNESFLI